MGPVRRGIPFTEPGRDDVGRVGGKNASSGELINRLGAVGIRVPPGFATTAEAYEELLGAHDLRGLVEARTDRLHEGARPDEVGAATRSRVLAQPLPAALRDAALTAYERLGEQIGREAPEVAVRSSATAEYLPEAGFAGRPVGLCGRRPSDEPAFTSILDAGLDSISVAPDSFAAVERHVARAEGTRGSGPGGGE